MLEEGRYSDLKAMGCVQANSSILSLEPVGFVCLFVWFFSFLISVTLLRFADDMLKVELIF